MYLAINFNKIMVHVFNDADWHLKLGSFVWHFTAKSTVIVLACVYRCLWFLGQSRGIKIG